MSVYWINKILYLVDNDPEFRERLMTDPGGALQTFRLTEEELEALKSGDVGRLYQMGVHTFFLNHLARYELFGVTRNNYLSLIRRGLDYDPRFEKGGMPIQYFQQDEGGQRQERASTGRKEDDINRGR